MPTLEIIPYDIKNDEALKQLDEVSRVAALKEEKHRIYEANLRQKRDTLVALDTALMEGRAKGKAEGRAEEKLTVAKNAIKMGLDNKSITELTVLSFEEVEKLRHG